MIYQVLLEEYLKLQPDLKKIYVVPLISKTNIKTDYLCRLYREFLDENKTGKPQIQSLSVFNHPQFLLGRLKGEKCILHYHWFEAGDLKSLIGIFWKIFWITLYRISGGKLVWTIHNKHPHEKKYSFINRNLRIFLAGIADKLHAHCRTAVEIMSPVLKISEKKFFIVPHPGFEAKIIPAQEAKEKLNKKYLSGSLAENDKLYLMFGAVAKYKGIKEVMILFNELKKNTGGGNKKLLVAGFIKKGNNNYYRELISLVNDKIILCPGLIPDEDVPLFFNSADYVIFNYEDVLTSGAVHLALSYKKPVIIPSLGCLNELNGSTVYKFETGSGREQNLLNILLNT